MTRDPTDQNDGFPSSNSLEEWIDQQAVSEGVSKEELFQKLISSYWTVNEMSQLVDETDTNHGPSSRTGPPSTTSDKAESAPDQVTELRELVKDIEKELQTEVRRSNQIGARTSTLAERISEIENKLAEVESQSESQITEIRDELQSLETELTSDRKNLEADLSSKFDDLQTILKFLVEKTDEFDDQIANIKQDYYGTVEQIEEEQKLLQKLKQDASDVGSYTGECETCGTAIDVALLMDPHCSQCHSQLTGVKKEAAWWILSKTVITTKGGPEKQPRTDKENSRSSSSNKPSRDDLREELDTHSPQETGSKQPDLSSQTASKDVMDNGSDADDPSDLSLDLGSEDISQSPVPEDQASEKLPFGDLNDLTQDEEEDDRGEEEQGFEWNDD
ncbi:hypothetical protein [Natrinema sp. H-ect4]|uniref:hypothetical protein n=1 Tax=Natrinema sp. H-ect4 TaxID=3242699 RepID=UPI0035A917CA